MMKYLVFITYFFLLNFCYAQECKVKLEALTGTYEGDCRKGLAHGIGKAIGNDTYSGEFQKGFPDGLGIYTWANGDRYEGEFKKGKMEGKGKLSVSKDGKLTEGFWKKGDYIGRYETPYQKIDKSTDISSFNISQSQGKANSVRIYLKENQNTVRDPNVNVVVHNGNYANQVNNRDFVELTSVTYPFKARLLMNQQYLEFEIFNDGSWDINVNITSINGLNKN